MSMEDQRVTTTNRAVKYKPGQFAMLPMAIYADEQYRNLKPYCQVVLIALMMHWNRKSKLAWPTQETLATELGLSRQWINKAVRHLKGAGLVQPDYFADLPGTSGITGFSSNTPDRSTTRLKQEGDSVVVNRSSVVIELIHVVAQHATTKVISIFDEDDDPTATPQYQEGITAAAASTSGALDGRPGGFKFVGRPGKNVFVRVGGTGGYTAGVVVVAGYYEQSLRDAPRGS